MDREGAGDARLDQPPGEVELDLPGAEAEAGLGTVDEIDALRSLAYDALAYPDWPSAASWRVKRSRTNAILI